MSQPYYSADRHCSSFHCGQRSNFISNRFGVGAASDLGRRETNRAGDRGLVFMVGFAVEARPAGGTAVGDGYIEGCWQFYRQVRAVAGRASGGQQPAMPLGAGQDSSRQCL